MEFEIVEAYLIRMQGGQEPKGWSLHVYFPEFDMDLRGLALIKTNKGGWWLKMPHKFNFDVDVNELITFPVLSFSSRGKHKDLVDRIREKAIEYVEEKLRLDPKLTKQ